MNDGDTLKKKKVAFCFVFVVDLFELMNCYSYGAYLKYVTVVVRVASKTNRQKTCLVI